MLGRLRLYERVLSKDLGAEFRTGAGHKLEHGDTPGGSPACPRRLESRGAGQCAIPDGVPLSAERRERRVDACQQRRHARRVEAACVRATDTVCRQGALTWPP